jgi:hypothetical protein
MATMTQIAQAYTQHLTAQGAPAKAFPQQSPPSGLIPNSRPPPHGGAPSGPPPGGNSGSALGPLPEPREPNKPRDPFIEDSGGRVLGTGKDDPMNGTHTRQEEERRKILTTMQQKLDPNSRLPEIAGVAADPSRTQAQPAGGLNAALVGAYSINTPRHLVSFPPAEGESSSSSGPRSVPQSRAPEGANQKGARMALSLEAEQMRAAEAKAINHSFVDMANFVTAGQ